jgi:uncharacterized membrane protein YphA (DoxX/SURF4 family)
MRVDTLRETTDNKLAASIRLLLTALFVMTGTMKLLVPMLGEAWSGQLLAANLPLYTVTRWSVPFVEIGLGVLLGVGAHARLSAAAVVGIMVAAAYVHVVVDDPSLFPLQPSEPIIPVIVIGLSAYVIWRGAGTWSLDLKATRTAAGDS